MKEEEKEMKEEEKEMKISIKLRAYVPDTMRPQWDMLVTDAKSIYFSLNH